MDASGNRDCQLASISVVKYFTDDSLTISAGSLFKNGAVRMLKAHWRRWVRHLCWWNLYAWLHSSLRTGWAKVDSMENHNLIMGDLKHGS